MVNKTFSENTVETAGTQWPFYREVLAEKSALWADQYALTMSQALFSDGKHDVNTTFQAYIRTNPFKGGYLLTAGQNIIFEWLEKHWKFDEADIAILREERIADPKTGEMKRLYTDEFIDMLANSKMELTVDAMPEGEIAFPDEPIVRINGPVWQCLMVEAGLLNAINSQSLFATLTSRITQATQGEPVLEFGLRRAQTLGGLEPTRAAYIGGIAATSNMLAKKHYGIPTSGTMAHAYIMLHENELDAFKSYARNMPYNGIFLVDTYDTIEGVKNAVRACKEEKIVLRGIRLDSGNLNELSVEARKILDEAGMNDVEIIPFKSKIAASNDLDENEVVNLKANGAKIDTWGIGTNLVTSKVQPALGAVYKLGAVFDYNRTISQEELDALKQGVKTGVLDKDALKDYVRDVIKLSGDEIKVSIPGELDVIRHIREDKEGEFRFNGDTITDNLDKNIVVDNALTENIRSIKKTNLTAQVIYEKGTAAYRPIKRFFEKGKRVAANETVHTARARAKQKLAMLSEEHKALVSPAPYTVGLEEKLYLKRQRKILDCAVAKTVTP